MKKYTVTYTESEPGEPGELWSEEMTAREIVNRARDYEHFSDSGKSPRWVSRIDTDIRSGESTEHSLHFNKLPERLRRYICKTHWTTKST